MPIRAVEREREARANETGSKLAAIHGARMITTRLATPLDADAIDAVYAPYVQRSTCTWQYEMDPPGARAAQIAARSDAHPMIVAEDAGAIVAFGSLSTFRAREGYRRTVESSVYVREDLHRRGVGAIVLRDLIARAGALGHRVIVAGISADQDASVAFHARFGFVEVGRMKGVGVKFGKTLDLVLMQRGIDAE